MTPFAELHELPRRLRRPAVRDLAWTLLSPALLSAPPCPQRHPLAGSAWAADPQRLHEWLRALDADDLPLRDWLARITSRRLGLYYEGLWQFALKQAPGVDLLASNLAIRTGDGPWASWTFCCAIAKARIIWSWPSNCTWGRPWTTGATRRTGSGLAAMIGSAANWHTWPGTSCPCRRTRRVAKHWLP